VLQDVKSFPRAQKFGQRPLQVAIIVPTFNEAENIAPLITRISAALADFQWEIIFVDDNSPDHTANVVREFALTHPHIRIVQRVGRRGLSSAVIEGMLASAAPIVAVIDGDMQHDEAILPDLIRAVADHRADIAIGTRYALGGGTQGWDAARLRLSRAATRLGQITLRVPLSDPMSGFFAVRRDVMTAALPRLSGIGFKILIDILASLPQHPRIVEIPYQFRNRVAGESKADSQIALEYLMLLADKTIGRILPLRLLSFLVVGGLGVGVHLSMLALALMLGIGFADGQMIAVATAIAFNFFLNNSFTYRDRRLRGARMWRGLASFFAVSAVGALANIGIGNWVHDMDRSWWLSAIAGIVVGAVWNFAASSFVTWRK
jgi:dolichol-phosphate mannosyltransferase